jgi:hypothetical protein
VITDQALALAEAARRCPLGEPGDAFDRGQLNSALLESPDGAPAHDDLDEVHGSSRLAGERVVR